MGYGDLKRILSLLQVRDVVKLLVLISAQILISFLDLLAILLIGIVTSTTFISAQGKSPQVPNLVIRFFDFSGLQDIGFNQQIGVLAIAAGLLLVIKSVLSALITRRQFIFLGIRAAKLGVDLYHTVLEQDFEKLNRSTPHEIQFSVIRGTNSLFMGVIGSVSVILNEFVFLIVMFIGLATFNVELTLIAFTYFATLALFLGRRFGAQIKSKSEKFSQQNVRSEGSVAEVVSLIREVHLRGTSDHFLKSFETLRFDNARISASIQFIPIVIKYWMEIALVLGALVFAAFQFLFYTAEQAIPILVVFILAATRVTPSILRTQNAYLTTKGSLGAGEMALKFMRQFKSGEDERALFSRPDYPATNLNSSILISNVSFGYKEDLVIDNLSLRIVDGDFVAVVGPTGGGKSTLLNLIMGQISPRSGSVTIGGIPSSQWVKLYRGGIGYVGQEPVFLNSTIRQNLLLGLDPHVLDDEEIWTALENAHISDFVRSLPEQLQTNMGSRGSKFSMGQRQRLSIARSILTKPKILLLDEATSALDAVTEEDISTSLSTISQGTTIVAVAHRLSTVRQARVVVYIDAGRVVATGSFQEVRREVPNFEKAAQIFGM